MAHGCLIVFPFFLLDPRRLSHPEGVSSKATSTRRTVRKTTCGSCTLDSSNERKHWLCFLLPFNTMFHQWKSKTSLFCTLRYLSSVATPPGKEWTTCIVGGGELVSFINCISFVFPISQWLGGTVQKKPENSIVAFCHQLLAVRLYFYSRAPDAEEGWDVSGEKGTSPCCTFSPSAAGRGRKRLSLFCCNLCLF